MISNNQTSSATSTTMSSALNPNQSLFRYEGVKIERIDDPHNASNTTKQAAAEQGSRKRRKIESCEGDDENEIAPFVSSK